MEKIIQGGSHSACHLFMLLPLGGQCLLDPGWITHLKGSPYGCPEAKQVSNRHLTLQPKEVFPEATSTLYLLAQCQTVDRCRKKRSFSFTFLVKP